MNKTQPTGPVTTRSVTTTISFPALRRQKGCAKKHGRMKPYTKGTGSTCAVLCGVKEYIRFIELTLCLHAYLHYSKDLLLEKRCKPEIFDQGHNSQARTWLHASTFATCRLIYLSNSYFVTSLKRNLSPTEFCSVGGQMRTTTA